MRQKSMDQRKLAYLLLHIVESDQVVLNAYWWAYDEEIGYNMNHEVFFYTILLAGLTFIGAW